MYLNDDNLSKVNIHCEYYFLFLISGNSGLLCFDRGMTLL